MDGVTVHGVTATCLSQGRKVRVKVTGPADKLSTHTHGHMNPPRAPLELWSGSYPKAQKQKLESPFPQGQCRDLGKCTYKDKSSMQPRFSAPQVTSGLCSRVTNTSLRLFINFQEKAW